MPEHVEQFLERQLSSSFYSCEDQRCRFLKNEDMLLANTDLMSYFSNIIDKTLPEYFEECEEYVTKQYWQETLSHNFHDMLGDYEKKKYNEIWREMVKTYKRP